MDMQEYNGNALKIRDHHMFLWEREVVVFWVTYVAWEHLLWNHYL